MVDSVLIALFAFLLLFQMVGCGNRSESWWEIATQDGGGSEGEKGGGGFAGIALVRWDHVYLVDLGGGEERRLTSREGGYGDLAF